MSIAICHLSLIEKVRNKIAEKVARRHVHKFFVPEKLGDTITVGDKKVKISFEVINPIEEFMSLYRRTKEKGWWEKYREGLLTLFKVLLQMSVTPDLAIIAQLSVWEGNLPLWEEWMCEVALVEVKRGKGGLSGYQREDVEIAKEIGVPYYLLRVDDSDFIRGKFTLILEPLTPKRLTLHEKFKSYVKEKH
jgi:hypothetical protein